MSDRESLDGENPLPGGGDRFNLEDRSTVEIWTQSLGITEEELRRAVEAAGTEVGNLYDHIQRFKQGRL